MHQVNQKEYAHVSDMWALPTKMVGEDMRNIVEIDAAPDLACYELLAQALNEDSDLQRCYEPCTTDSGKRKNNMKYGFYFN